MAAAIPLIGTGISAVMGARNQKKQGDALKAQQAMAQQQAANGQQLFNVGMPALNQSANYYSRLLNGSRSGMTAALAPEIGATTDVYRGAERSLERSGVRGAQRDVAKADLARDQAGKISGLMLGVRPAAAQSLGTLAGNALGAGQGYTGLYGNLMGQAQQTRAYNDEQSGALWNNIGRLLVGSYDAYKNRGGSGNAGGYSA